jgi:hypothetical protein
LKKAEMDMSDPRYTGSGRPDPRMPPGDEPIEPRLQTRNGSWDPMWGWVAAIVALAVVIVLVAGYYRNEPSTAARNPPAPTTSGPTTTGSAPSNPNPNGLAPGGPIMPVPIAPPATAPATPANPGNAPVAPAPAPPP